MSAKTKKQPFHKKLIMGLLFAVAMTSPVGAADGQSPESTIGADVVVFDLFDTARWGTVGDTTAYSVGTESCNAGDQEVAWIWDTNEHPVIAQNLYRHKDGRLEQLGQSWLKHGFVSINGSSCGTCVPPPNGGAQLGVGCSDPYWASLNGEHNRLGPRSQVNAYTGIYEMPHGEPDNGVYTTLSGRLLVPTADVTPAQNVGALYFVEGQYVAQDDADDGNGLNNSSHRQITVAENLDLIVSSTNPTDEGKPAIAAWKAIDPSVTVEEVDVPREGRFYIAYATSDNGNGTWRYEYAIFNLNSHRSARSFSVPIESNTVITNVGFHDVDSHSGEPYDTTDWVISVDNLAGSVSWSTEDFASNENANALRWGTMYNFWFDADAAPQSSVAQIGLYRPGTPDYLNHPVTGPQAGSALIFSDGFESGDLLAW